MKTKLLLAAAVMTGGSLFAQYQPDPYGYDNGPYNDPYYDQGYAAPAPPQAPAYAYQPPQPAAGYIWIDGFWNVSGGRYVWSNGYWSPPPYAGGYWIAPRYYGGTFYRGHWDRDHERFEHHENERRTFRESGRGSREHDRGHRR